MSTNSCLLITAQFVLLGYLIITGVLTSVPYLIFFQAIGIAIAIWGIITIRIGNFNIQPEVKSSELITVGPFRFVRNPMYLGILCVFIPAVMAHPNPLRWLALGLLAVVLLLKIRSEEQFLILRFGDKYANYVEQTKRLIPFIF